MVAIAILLLSAVPANAFQSSRIETRRGAVYSECDFTIDNTYKVVVVNCADQKLNVGFGDIAFIYDESGNDVTAQYLGKYYRPVEPETPPTVPPAVDSSDSVATPQDDLNTGESTAPGVPAGEVEWMKEEERTEIRKSKPYNAGLHAFPTFSIPIGDYYEGFNPGIGFGGEISIALAPEYAIRLNVTRQGASLDEDEFNRMFSAITGRQVLRNNLSTTMMHYSVSFQYYGWPRWKDDGQLWWYLTSGLGVISHSLSGTMDIYDPIEMLAETVSVDDSETKFILSMGAGLVPMLSRTVGIECAANWDIVFVGTYEDESAYQYNEVQTAVVLDLRVGLVFLLRDN